MTVDVRPTSVTDAVKELSRRLYVAEQQLSRPLAGSDVVNLANPSVDTITIGGIVVGAPASSASNLVLTTGSFMEDIWIDADWDAPVDGTAVEYDVELARKVSSSYELVQNFNIGGGTSLRMSSLEPQQTYGVRVTAINRIQARSTPLPSSGFMDVSTGIDATIPSQTANFQLLAGIRTVMATWNEVADRDVARGTGTYEVQLATNAVFTSLFASRFTSATVVSFSGVTSSTTYWGRVRAVDNSGNAGAWSTAASVTTAQTGTVDIAPLAVENAQIANLAVDDAKIANLSADKITVGVLNADRIAANSLDVNKLTASTLTSKTITIGSGGVLKIGNPPTTGLQINDQGIRLYSGGVVKVALDVAGTATFEGNINASTITSSTLTAATINSGTITGTTVRTAASGQRIALENTAIDALFMYSGHASESSAGRLAVAVNGAAMICQIDSPKNGNDWASMTLTSVAAGNGSNCSWLINTGANANKAAFQLGSASNAAVAELTAQGISQATFTFGGGSNTQLKLKGSGDYAFVYFFGGGQEATINVNIGLGAGIHVMNGTNATFQPVQASAFNVSSSVETKKNVRTELEALTRLNQLRVVRFNRAQVPMKNPPAHIQRFYDLDELGFLADEMLPIMPEAVVLDENSRPVAINLAVIVALLVKSLQEVSEALPGRS